MSEVFDVAVVGAGPGGLAAAATASEAGMRVCLIDDNPQAGGQIWRSKLGKPSANRKATEWLKRIHKSVDVRFGCSAVDVRQERGQGNSAIKLERAGQYFEIEYSALILATGARELFLPFPGWTLPGVYGVGGLQAFVKSGLDVSGKRIVLAGTGPLLLAVAANLRGAGAEIVAIVEQAPLQRLAKFTFGLLFSQTAKIIEGAGYGMKMLGVPYQTSAWVTKALGDECIRGVEVVLDSGVRKFDIDMLAIGFHLVPSTELAQLLGCDLQNGFVKINEMQQTSLESVFCVGETTGIGGAEKAQVEGRIAAFAAGGQLDKARSLFKLRDRQSNFARRLETAFELRKELRDLAQNDTIVCRCEDVAHRTLKNCKSWRAAKLHARCGMGPCQGRVCGAAAQFLYGWDVQHPRPPLFPVEVETLAGMQRME